MMRKLLVIGTALWAFSLTGCDLYYGTPNTERCDIWGCEGEEFRPGPVEPGGDCRTNDQCAAGCYCDPDQAICIETGFCNLESDCPGEFTCDERATCVPLDDDGDCDRLDGDGDCCDEEDGDCGDPPPPPPNPGDTCTSDEDCLGGCFCDPNTMTCVESGFCDADLDCIDIIYEDGTTDEAECDAVRNTCVPSTTPEASCNETITCEGVARPTDCPPDRTPAIVDGCYVTEGAMEDRCLLRSDCEAPPLASCDDISSENQCENRLDCRIAYDGTDCTCNGNACDCWDPGVDENGNPYECTCAVWTPRCESI